MQTNNSPIQSRADECQAIVGPDGLVLDFCLVFMKQSGLSEDYNLKLDESSGSNCGEAAIQYNMCNFSSWYFLPECDAQEASKYWQCCYRCTRSVIYHFKLWWSFYLYCSTELPFHAVKSILMLFFPQRLQDLRISRLLPSQNFDKSIKHKTPDLPAWAYDLGIHS